MSGGSIMFMCKERDLGLCGRSCGSGGGKPCVLAQRRDGGCPGRALLRAVVVRDLASDRVST